MSLNLFSDTFSGFCRFIYGFFFNPIQQDRCLDTEKSVCTELIVNVLVVLWSCCSKHTSNILCRVKQILYDLQVKKPPWRFGFIGNVTLHERQQMQRQLGMLTTNWINLLGVASSTRYPNDSFSPLLTCSLLLLQVPRTWLKGSPVFPETLLAGERSLYSCLSPSR